MSLQTKSVPIVTDPSGADVTMIRAGGVRIHAIRIELGTLETPDITITEDPSTDSILALTGVAASVTKYPTVLGQTSAGANIAGAAVAFPVYDRIKIVTAGGGDTKTGRVILLLER